MLYVADQLGDHGVAGVYRLYEVFAQRFGLNDDFSGSILLAPPFTEEWLAQEILTPWPKDAEDIKPYDDPHEVPLAQFNRFLAVCGQAGILRITTKNYPSCVTNADGTQTPNGTHTWRILTIPGFAELKDEWAARKGSRKESMALSTPE